MHTKTCENHTSACSLCLSSAGHSEKAFDRFAITPDNKHVVFLGKDGYMIFLSGRVRAVRGEGMRGDCERSEGVGCEG